MPDYPPQGVPILQTVLGDYEASIAESSHVFSFPAINFDDDSMLMLVIDGEVSAALSLQLRINTVSASSYFYDGYRIATGVQTILDFNSQSAISLLSNIILDAASIMFSGKAEIFLTKGGFNRINVHSTMGTPNTVKHEVLQGTLIISQSSITDVEIFTSTSTWKIGTRMTLYKVSRG